MSAEVTGPARSAGSLRWRRPAMETLFLATEGIAWFIVLASIATAMERAFLERMETRLQGALGVGDVSDRAAAQLLQGVLREHEVVTSGPTMVAVLLAAAGGFLLMRVLRHYNVTGGLASVVLITATIVGVNVLLHVAVRGDVRIWDTGALVDLVAGPEARYGGREGLDLFVRDPRLNAPHGDALAFTLVGLTVVWVRYLLAGRSEVTLERMARSFTGSFVVVLVMMALASAGGVGLPSAWIVAQFMLGMLGLAVANHHRALPTEEAASRTTAWVTSVGATIALLMGSVGLVALLAYLHFEVVLRALGTVVMAIVVVVATIIVTPIYWVFDQIFQRIFHGRTLEDSLPRIPEFRLMEMLAREQEGADGLLPAWVGDSFKMLVLVVVLYAAYRIGRRLVRPRRALPSDGVESRVRSSGGASIGELLAGIVRLPGRSRAEAWLARHRVYQLYGRMVQAGTERGLPRLAWETPTEYGATAARLLSAPSFVQIGAAFDRARYGRHYPSSPELQVLFAELEQWDKAHPPSEEQRARLRGARRMSAEEELDLQIQRAKETVRDGRVGDPLF